MKMVQMSKILEYENNTYFYRPHFVLKWHRNFGSILLMDKVMNNYESTL